MKFSMTGQEKVDLLIPQLGHIILTQNQAVFKGVILLHNAACLLA
jgi:hypothetical protein